MRSLPCSVKFCLSNAVVRFESSYNTLTTRNIAYNYIYFFGKL